MKFNVKEISFGELHYGTSDIEAIIPKRLPARFMNHKIEPWNSIAEQWFNTGIRKESVLIPIYGTDKEMAIKHIQCLFNTWALDKEVKIRNASFLLYLWFSSVRI